MESIITDIWLEGNPIFSLTYKNIKFEGEKKVYENIKTDLTRYRPDPRDYLHKNKIYKAKLFFDNEFDLYNDSCQVLRKIIVNDHVFVNIR